MENMTIFSKVITEDTSCTDQTSVTTKIKGKYKGICLQIRHEIHKYHSSGLVETDIDIWTDNGSMEKELSAFLNRMPPGQQISLNLILGGVVEKEIPKTVQMLRDNEKNIPGAVACYRYAEQSEKGRLSETVTREVRYG